MIPWFYLDRVYQTMSNSLHYRRTAEQTDLLVLMKMINVTANVSQRKSSKRTEKIKVTTSTLYPAQTQIHASGTD